MAKRILLAGPPAAGKSAVIAALTSHFGDSVLYSNLDTEIDRLCAERGYSGPLCDAVVDEAVAALLSHGPRADWVCELPHHDYISLIAAKILQLDNFDCIVLIHAQYETLIQRNASRQSHVPEAYIARCAGSTRDLVDWLRVHGGHRWLLCDSGILQPEHIAVLVQDYLQKRVRF
jgi:hypothetical protein